MTLSLSPRLRQAAACLGRALCTLQPRLAIIVAIAVALASSAHAASVPLEVRATGTGSGVLLIPGLASSGTTPSGGSECGAAATCPRWKASSTDARMGRRAERIATVA